MDTRSKKRKQQTSGGDSTFLEGPLLNLAIPDDPLGKGGNNNNNSVESGPQSKKQHNQALEAGNGQKPKPRAVKKGRNVKDIGENKKGKKKKRAAQFRPAFTNSKLAKKLISNGNNALIEAYKRLAGKSLEEKLLLTAWELPESVVQKYHSKGVTSLFPWQVECLDNERVLLEGRNLLYSAPTSAGKTLVAEILMIRRITQLGKKAIMILPFVSVCREKMYGLQELLSTAGIRVEGFMGSYAPPGGFNAVDIAICTIEKANSLINRLLEDKCLSQLGTIVVDELHLIGDPNRGYLLELLLTKIRFMMEHSRQLDDSIISDDANNSGNAEDSESNKLNIQIIGMSATLPNLKLLSNWIDAELIISEYRPVPLVQRLSLNGRIYDESMEHVRDVKIPSFPIEFRGDDENLVYLSLETVLNGHSILIFCPTKAKCEYVAEQIAREFFNVGNLTKSNNGQLVKLGHQLRGQLKGKDLMEVLMQLKQCPGGLEVVLKKTVSFGVAFHHAGLTYDERDIIESYFKKSVIRVIVATSTLSAGVNLPARRVIVSSPMACTGPLDVMTYRQMCGRAGRKGVDTEGESILVCTNSTKDVGFKLVQSTIPFVKSALMGNEGALTSSMKRALLEIIACGIARRPSDVENYAKCTLLTKSIEAGLYEDNDNLPNSQQNKEKTIQECLCFLQSNEFIRLQTYEDAVKTDEYMTTQLGSACLVSSLAPDEGITVYKELQNARKCFVLESELHVVYQVTPIYLSEQLRNIPWLTFISLCHSLSEQDKKVATLVGVEETFLMRAMIGTVSLSSKNQKEREQYMVHQRFYAALALNDLVNEMPISEVSMKYSLNKGVIQNLQQAASTFAGMVTAFCGKLEWSNLELLLSQFQERLQFGVHRELCDLVRLETMNGQRARILYDHGIKTVAQLAESDAAKVEKILHHAIPFQSAVHGEGVSQRQIWILGKNAGLSEVEASQQIVNEARQFIQMEFGPSIVIDFNHKRSLWSQDDVNGDVNNESDNDQSSADEIKNLINSFQTM